MTFVLYFKLNHIITDHIEEVPIENIKCGELVLVKSHEMVLYLFSIIKKKMQIK